jgi:hypothetical protein
MRTRSQSKLQELSVNIDFNQSSKAWLKNKIPLGNGTYEYVKTEPKRIITRSTSKLV